MYFRRFPFMVISLSLTFDIAAGALSHARAGTTHALVIAANDGYGVEECLAEGRECGQVVADAWCEAHGHGAAVSFGLASRFAVATNIAAKPEPYVVNCSD